MSAASPDRPFNEALNEFHQSANYYQIGINTNGWYTANNSEYNTSRFCQNIGNSASTFTNCRSIFSREIKIDELYKDDGDSTDDPNEATKIKFSVNVFWFNETPKKVTLSSEITNWKARFEE